MVLTGVFVELDSQVMDSIVQTLMNALMVHMHVVRMVPALTLKVTTHVSVTLDSIRIVYHVVTSMNALLVPTPAQSMPNALTQLDPTRVNAYLDSLGMVEPVLLSVQPAHTYSVKTPVISVPSIPTAMIRMLSQLAFHAQVVMLLKMLAASQVHSVHVSS